MSRYILSGADGTRIGVSTLGERRDDEHAILLVHGWARTARYWDDISRVLARDRFVVVPDLRMHGESLPQEEGDIDISIPIAVEDMSSILGALGVSSCIAVGHSMGAQVVTMLADSCPVLVRATVALEPAYGAAPEEIAAAEQRKQDHLSRALADFQRDRPDSPAAVVERYARALIVYYDSEYLLGHSIGAAEATRAVLRRRSRPALAVYATDVGAETERELTAGAAVRPDIVRWRLGGGHDFPAEHPGAAAELIVRWIDRITGGS